MRLYEVWYSGINMEDKDKLIDELKTEIVSLKIRLKRIEEYLTQMPNVEDYLETETVGRMRFDEEKDEFFEEAVKLVKQRDKASASLLQRRFHIGFNRAARLIQQLEEHGVVGAGEGATPREVLVR
jgi:S-DNA-T family DNA segregation ATPase FtsK/SpoIIIE